MIAPTPQLAAGLEVLHRALIEIRLLGYRDALDEEQCRRLASLADAVHNLPHLLLMWEACDEGQLRSVLEHHDRTWEGHLATTWAETERMHEGPPDGAWRIDYADGSANRYALVDDGSGDVDVTYDPVTPAMSSSGRYSGGPPRHAVVRRDDRRLAELWSRLLLACLGWGAARAMGTGAFTMTTTAGVREHVLAPGATLAAIDELLATFGA